MARLLRLHFASVGVSSARFAPLTLDFRTPDGAGRRGANSVLWLRNGGGKSSILNLLFSLVVPHRSRFLGETADGRSQRFSDYIKPQDLSFIVAEWFTGNVAQQDLVGGKNELHTWVTGQMIHWLPNQSQQDDSNLKRWFFAFRTGVGMELESLPIQGLSGPAVDSPKGFRDWFKAQGEALPAAQCYSTDKQGEWEKNLAETMCLDPELFRQQLEMNRAEGGADRIMRFKTAADFAEFIFRLSADARPAERLLQKLEELRTKQRQRPTRQLEERFVVAMLEPMEQLERDALRLPDCEDAVRGAAARIASHHQAIAERLDALAAAEQAAANDARRAAGEAEAFAAEAGRQERFRAWYHRQHLINAMAEAEQKLGQAHARLDAARRAVRGAEAARFWLKLRGTREKLGALRAARQQAQLDRAPQLEALRVAAAAFHVALRTAISEADGQLGRLRQSERVNSAGQAATAADLQRLRVEKARLDKAIGAAETAIRQRDMAWGRLVGERIVAANDDAGTALRLRKDEVSRLAHEQEALELAVAAAEANGVDVESREREVAAALARVEQKHETELLHFEKARNERDRLESDVLRQEFAPDGDGAFDEQLVQLLFTAMQREAQRLVALAIEGLEDTRADEHFQRTGLLPPPLPVQETIAALRKQGIPAQAASEYLANQGFDEPRLSALVASDSARASGVVVMTPELLRQVQGATPPASLAQPVVVALPDTDTAPTPSDRHTLLPASLGAYSQEAALVEQGHRERRIASREARGLQATARRDALQRYHDDLVRFQREWQGGRFDELGRLVAALELERVALVEQRRGLAAERVDLERRKAEAKASLARSTSLLTQAQKNCDRLDQFHREHEFALPAHRVLLTDLASRLEGAEGELERLEAHGVSLRVEGERLRLEIRDHTTRLQRLSSEVVAIPAEYLGGPPSDSPSALEVARVDYEQSKRTYEENPAIALLNGEIRQLEELEQSQQAEFSRAAEGLTDAEWRRFADDAFPEAAMAGVSDQRDEANSAHTLADSELNSARRALQLEERRAPMPSPPAGASACKDAVAYLRAAEEAAAASQELSRQRDDAKRAEGIARGRAKDLGTDQQQLRRIAKPLERIQSDATAEGTPSLPEALEEIDRLVDQLLADHATAEAALRDLRVLLGKRVAASRRVANEKPFEELDDVLRSWVRADDDEVIAGIARKTADLRMRLVALRMELETFEADRSMVVTEFDEFARACKRHMEHVEKVSLLPQGLGEWSGQRFLEVKLPGAAQTHEERRARLLPLLDELTMPGAVLPPPDLLAVRTVEALLGSGRRLDIQLIKPHALGTVQRYPVGALGSFSDGERLTASVLIYCTLAQLRARNRGQRGELPDAGALILDNPIGKCSHHGLIELQQQVAKALNVQLVYTTGIEDLGALASFPRVIRLTNNSRSSRTGDLHVRNDDSFLRAAAISISLPEAAP